MMSIQSMIRKRFPWKTFKDILFILLGALCQAFSLRLFLVPGSMVSGGISGAAQIISHFVNFPIGLMVIIGNLPLFILGWRYLGGKRFAFRTALAVGAFSVFTDVLMVVMPSINIASTDNFLNAIYGGLLLGIGLGLVYRAQGTSGGSDILGRILNHRMGLSISVAYLLTDGLVVLASGFAFGWVKALYGLIVIYVSGLAAETISEGSNIFRTALIVTTQSREVSSRVMQDLERGVTILQGTGGYTGSERPVLYVVITRSEVNQLKEIVHEEDPAAFMVIGAVHEALGEGFRKLKNPDK